MLRPPPGPLEGHWPEITRVVRAVIGAMDDVLRVAKSAGRRAL